MSEKEHFFDSPYLTDNLKNYPEQLPLLLSVARPRVHEAGEMIFMQGEEVKREFYLIEEGRVKISLLNRNGVEKIISIQERMTLFGYSAPFDGHPYFYTATALEPTTLQVIRMDRFLALAAKNPGLFLLVLQSFSRVTRMLVLQIGDFSFMDADRRVAHMICKIVSEVGQKTQKGLLMTKKLTQEEIASLTGLSRVSVSLALNRFEELGLLRKKRNLIEVFDIEELKKRVENF